jgi:hypothetical protein
VTLDTESEKGMGDATWLFDLKDVVVPPCVDHKHHKHGGFNFHHRVKTCDYDNDANFINMLLKAGRQAQGVM